MVVLRHPVVMLPTPAPVVRSYFVVHSADPATPHGRDSS